MEEQVQIVYIQEKVLNVNCLFETKLHFLGSDDEDVSNTCVFI